LTIVVLNYIIETIEGFNGLILNETKDFMKVIYADNNATTQIAPEVLEAMLPFLKEYYGNPSSMHTFGGQVHRHIEEARGRVAALIGAEPQEIIFTSCGTESDNTAIRGTLEAFPEKRHIITTRVEHPAVKNVCRYLSSRGYRVTELSVNGEGLLDPEELRKSLSDDTAVVSIMYANNETGVIFPIEEISEIVKERGISFHVDSVQAVGKIPVDLKKLPIDLLSLSGHKLHAPKGVGALYIRRGTKITPFMIGGHQERGRRGGTENVASIIGLGKACELAHKFINEENVRVKKMRDRLEKTILKEIPDCRINGHPEKRLPNTATISFEYVEGEAILLSLSEAGICASSGSACTSGSLEPSYVLRAMGIPFTAINGSIRFSLSRYNTEKDIDYIVTRLKSIIEKLRSISPFGAK
jgi:cysteine desulfurase